MHGCLGEQFGFLQVKTIVSLLLRRFEIEPLCALPEPNYKVMVVGRKLVCWLHRCPCLKTLRRSRICSMQTHYDSLPSPYDAALGARSSGGWCSRCGSKRVVVFGNLT